VSSTDVLLLIIIALLFIIAVGVWRGPE